MFYISECVHHFIMHKTGTDCCDKSDGLSHDELRAVSSAQMAILHRTLSERQLKYKRRDGSRLISELIAHLEDDLCF